MDGTDDLITIGSCGSWSARRTARVDPAVGEPFLDVGGVEAEEVAPLDVGDAALVDEAAHMTDFDAEMVGEIRHVHEMG